MQVTKFIEKLNKVDGNIYVIEERVTLVDGVYEGMLEHDNITPISLSIHTGPRLTGERIETYAVSTPSLTPWKRSIRIYADVPVVYISYETDGDTVEAEDINSVQKVINITQRAVNAEEERAETVEKGLAEEINTETKRAIQVEQQLDERIGTEEQRADSAEKELRNDLEAESKRAITSEKKLTDDLSAEVTRAVGAERILSDSIVAESNRSQLAEKAIADNLAAESNRAKVEESRLQNGIQTETGRAEAAEASIRSTIETNRPIWNDKYTRNEIDNKFSALETAIDWKEAVDTYANIATTYPQPEDGWTVNVKDTDYTYRWSGTEWVAISANAIPKATQSVDGILSKEDKAAYDDAYSKRHIHANKSVIDKITQAFLDNWTDAYNKRHEHENKSVLDKITQTLLDNWSAAYSHISDTVKHITATDRTNWNDANSKKHTHDNESVIDKLTQVLLDKLDGIADGAEVNVQADWNVVDEKSDAYIKNKPTAMPASDVLAWAKAANKPAYNWTEITSKPLTYPPSSHKHTKSQITDMPSKVSEFTNDAGYITQDDVDKSQNHSHSNKAILDKITQELLNKLTNIKEYVHPSTAGNKHIPAGGASGQFLKWSADGTAIWAADNNTTYSVFKGATGSAAGGGGLVPAPAKGDNTTKYLKADGTWQTPPDTKYTHSNSGVTPGTYQSVTVDVQGHVTGGTPQGPFTWNQVHGAYTWDQLKGV